MNTNYCEALKEKKTGDVMLSNKEMTKQKK